MVSAGYSEIAFEGFVDETIALLIRCLQLLPQQNNLASLVGEFNRVEKAIVQHFRVSLPLLIRNMS